eukprot:2777636-Prorocentrum_lima.AAC.1
MTSSLVGSEMCIRDRMIWRPCIHREIALDSLDFMDMLTEDLRFYNVHTVSYTHLTLPTICSV